MASIRAAARQRLRSLHRCVLWPVHLAYVKNRCKDFNDAIKNSACPGGHIAITAVKLNTTHFIRRSGGPHLLPFSIFVLNDLCKRSHCAFRYNVVDFWGHNEVGIGDADVSTLDESPGKGNNTGI
ncbi:hypothetical protein AJ80_08285, partial [Polytolypa hystricis UAMH7299]